MVRLHRPLAGALATVFLAAGCGGSDHQTTKVARPDTQAIREARSSGPAARSARREAAHPSRTDFRSLHEAIDFISQRVDVPVVVPSTLPDGTRLTEHSVFTNAPDRRAQLGLLLPAQRVLTIQYGVAGFDGCGPLNLRSVEVGHQPALLEARSDANGRKYAALLWPATKRTLQGRYGLSGPFSAQRLLSFARSMERTRSTTPAEGGPGC